MAIFGGPFSAYHIDFKKLVANIYLVSCQVRHSIIEWSVVLVGVIFYILVKIIKIV